MKRWKIGILASLVVVCMSLALVGCQQQTYSPQSKSPTVSASALGKAETLRVGVNASSAPLAGQTSSSSRIVGIDVDVAAYLADQLGLKVEIVDVGNDPVSALKDGTVDVVLGVDSSEDDAAYWRSDPYLETGVALFGAADETNIPAAGTTTKIAAQASSRSSWRVTNLYGDASLVSKSDLKSAFEALGSGEAQYVAADAVIGTYVSYTNGFADKIVALLQDPSGYCAAVASSNSELQTAIGSAVKSLVDGGIMDIIENKWLGTSVDLDSITVVKSGTDSKSGASASAASASAASASAESASPEGEATSEGEAANAA